MKNWVKSQMDRINLSHIAWMIAGVYLTEFFTWLIYKNPKKITAPGLSATVAVFALILAVYSAYQVKKWISGKVNDKGFKKCETIVDKIQEIAMSAGRINRDTQNLFISEIVILDDTKFNKTIEKLESETEKLSELELEMLAHAMHLPIWGFGISEEYRVKEFAKGLLSLRSAVKSTIMSSKKFRASKDFSQVNKDRVTYEAALVLVKEFIDKVNESTFNDIFVNTQSK